MQKFINLLQVHSKLILRIEGRVKHFNFYNRNNIVFFTYHLIHLEINLEMRINLIFFFTTHSIIIYIL